MDEQRLAPAGSLLSRSVSDEVPESSSEGYIAATEYPQLTYTVEVCYKDIIKIQTRR